MLCLRDLGDHLMRSFNRLHTMYWPLLASLIALSTYLARHRHGIGLSPDGWAYWQGAVSMLEALF
jgi:hypothetical protein